MTVNPCLALLGLTLLAAGCSTRGPLFGAEPQAGMQVEMHREDGTVIPLLITNVDETSITVDANHPLAGEELHFNIQLAAIAA